MTVFQHTAARRRLVAETALIPVAYKSFNTQPPEGGWHDRKFCDVQQICFNTQPPEGGWTTTRLTASCQNRFQHTAARRRLALSVRLLGQISVFQHTAARRRLGNVSSSRFAHLRFQHTAARRRLVTPYNVDDIVLVFQHTAARRRLDLLRKSVYAFH